MEKHLVWHANVADELNRITNHIFPQLMNNGHVYWFVVERHDKISVKKTPCGIQIEEYINQIFYSSIRPTPPPFRRQQKRWI